MQHQRGGENRGQEKDQDGVRKGRRLFNGSSVNGGVNRNEQGQAEGQENPAQVGFGAVHLEQVTAAHHQQTHHHQSQAEEAGQGQAFA